jgi:uncharacterized integral membrane protein
MRTGIWPVLVVLVLTAAFTLINWTTFTTPTTLNVGVAMVTAPLGLVMLGAVVLLAVLYIASVVALQGRALIESRRMTRDLQAQRDLAEKAEASRFTELRDFMNLELQRVTRANDEARAALLGRMDQMEQRQRATLEETANSLSAYIGQLEDRFEHATLPPEARVVPPPMRDDRAPR